jgi:hypothetical protein
MSKASELKAFSNGLALGANLAEQARMRDDGPEPPRLTVMLAYVLDLHAGMIRDYGDVLGYPPERDSRERFLFHEGTAVGAVEAWAQQATIWRAFRGMLGGWF